MKINFNKSIYAINGEVLKDGDKDAKLKDLTIAALMFNDEKASGNEKFKRWNLAKKIYDAKDEIDVPAEEIALIKDLIGKAFMTSVVGSVYSILEGQ